MDKIITVIKDVSIIEHLIFIINIITFLLSRKIITTFSKTRDENSEKEKLLSLRIINLILLSLYLLSLAISVLCEKDQNTSQILRNISQTGLTLLLSFICAQFCTYLSVKKYGKEKEIDDETVHTQTYQSEIFSLFGALFIAVTAFFIVINIWDITEVLQVTGVIGGIAIIAFSTKDVWAPDNINGLILLYNGNIETGSIIKNESLDLFAIVIKVTLTQVVLRDIPLRHEIIIPNSKFRNTKIEILNNTYSKEIRDYIDFNIGYNVHTNRVDNFFETVWNEMVATNIGINPQKKPKHLLINTGDHALTWRFFYTIEKNYRIKEIKYTINRIAFEKSVEMNIGLDTPITHKVSIEK